MFTTVKKGLHTRYHKHYKKKKKKIIDLTDLFL